MKRNKTENFAIFNDLYNSYYESIFRYLYIRLGGLKDQAYDLASETFFSLWKVIDKLDLEKNPKSFIFTIAKNKLIDFRKAKSNKNISLEEIQFSPVLEKNNNPDKEIQIGRIIEKLNLLNYKEKDVIILRYLEDWDDKEISQTLGIQSVNVRVIAHRAIKKLKQILNEQKNEPNPKTN